MNIRPLVLFAIVCTFVSALLAQETKKPYEPRIAPKSGEAKAAIGAMKIPEGFKVDLWAAEPNVANPVAFAIDEKGRIFVAETFRQGDEGGVVDNRNHMYWLDEDLAAQTVEDRRAFFLKHRKDKVEQWTKHHDRIRLLEDTKGAGFADKATVFSTGYNDLMDGTGAGLLAWRGNVYYTNIPKVYVLRDNNNDGVADDSKVLSDGYGVRVAFRGHDLHGLVMGPDGRIYFSIGDRGYHIKTKEGKLLHDPGAGAVFRCEPDGSHLEVVHTGLRNPQELVFDDFGNLFTGDNNSDGGDRARWTYIIEGGHTGWDMAFQYLPDRGPWNREGWWHEWDAAKSPTQFAAHVVPPIKHIGNGPSGVTYYPGTGFDDSYRGTFFMCDFKGGANVSGIWSFKLKPNGAWFTVDGLEQFAWNTLVTDTDFGPDGALYFSDWVHGWNGEGKGRIYRMTHAEGGKSAVVAETKKLLAEGFKHRSEKELAELLGHPNRSVRQEAQFALVDRKDFWTLRRVFLESKGQLSRIHALWGLGQILRLDLDRGGDMRLMDNAQFKDTIGAVMSAMSSDVDPEIRAQILRVFASEVVNGWSRGAKVDEDVELMSGELLTPRLRDPDPRVRFFAAFAFGRIASPKQLDRLLQLLRDNADKDPYLRHAAVMGLTYLNDADALVAKMRDENRSARLGILLALRRMGDQRVSFYLHDSDKHLAVEAARAIHDQPIEEAMPQLAAMIGYKEVSKDEALIRRSISANYRLGGVRQAQVIAGFVQNPAASTSMRIEALDALVGWAGQSKRDRVLGSHRPVLPRPADEVKEVAGRLAVNILQGTGDNGVRQAAAKVIEQYRIAAAAPLLLEITKDAKQVNRLRISTLRALGVMNDPSLTEAVTSTLGATDANLRKEARQWLSKLKPAQAMEALDQVLETGEISEKQGAIATLADMKQAGADTVLEKQLDKLLAGKLQSELALELLEASSARATPRMKLKLAAYETAQPKDDSIQGKRHLLAGGDPEAGKKIFWERSAASCNRCHKVGSEGVGEAGPNLGEIGKQMRDYILESVLYPNKKIAQGFDTFDIETNDGDRIIGVLREDKPDELVIFTPENKRIVVKKKDISEKRKALSAMPDNISKLLTEREIRDLVEYLATLK